ncbi:MAG: MBOAT family O-acyltransferase [Planctomycetota bacterium]|jgi:D-alanyl-lipoteichoic acid acyltransferase DltB (MBOAT superfamily)
MVFSSYTFMLLFLPVCLVGFWLLARGGGRGIGATLWLVACSLAFCGWGDPFDLVPLVGSIVVNYLLGRWLELLTARSARTARRAVLVTGVAFNLALLGYFKYTGFFLGQFGIDAGTIVLPLAISFYTFQQIAYLVDVSRGLTHEHRFADYCLFVTFFPQLIAGPIVHHRDMLPQFVRRAFRFRAEDVSVGIGFFVVGLTKKVLVADTLAGPVAAVFDGGEPLGMADAWVGALAYTMQLYFDFSGYSDMAIGLGRLFGVRLPFNFHSPYRATSPSEFWRRWHMTLSAFLRDYLYIPLGGNRRGGTRKYVNLMVTMLLGGLWHGAAWTFVLWGGLHGLGLMVHHAWRAVVGTRLGPGGFGRVLAGRAFTFGIVVMGWVLFRAEDFPAAGRVYAAMFGAGGLGLELAVVSDTIAMMVAVLLVVVWCCPNTQQLMRRYRPGLEAPRKWEGWPPVGRWRWRPITGWGLFMAALTLVALMHNARVPDFIYFRF